MGDIRGSVIDFLQRTKAKFDYYAGGQFFKKPRTKIVPQQPEPTNEEVNTYIISTHSSSHISPQHKDPPRKSKRKRVNVLPYTNPPPSVSSKLERIPISPIKTTLSPPPSPPVVDNQVPSPLPTRKRVRLTKPSKSSKQAPLPMKVNDPPAPSPHPPQGMSYFLDTRNYEAKDQPFYLDLFKKSVRTFKPLPKPRPTSSHWDIEKGGQRPQRRVKTETFELVDDEGERVEKCRIFKESNKFFGDLEKLSGYDKDCRDNDIQTTYEEREHGAKRSIKVLTSAIRVVSCMQVYLPSLSSPLVK